MNSNTAGNFFAGNGLFTPPVGSGAPPRKGDPKDPLVIRFRVALEDLVGASSKKDLEETRKFLKTGLCMNNNALISAVDLLLETLEEV